MRPPRQQAVRRCARGSNRAWIRAGSAGMLSLGLALHEGGVRPVTLRPLRGDDELCLQAPTAAAAIELLARLAHTLDGSALALAELSVSQVDRLLAALYGELYGNAAECRVRCGGCGERYEFTLDLVALQSAQDAARPPPCDAQGGWSFDEDCRLRAPRLADLELAATPAQLLGRLLLSGSSEGREKELLEFLERAAPVLSLDLAAPCPHCAREQSVRFDLARYLAQRLHGERPFLLRETHLIASRYGWSHTEVMALSRDDRRAYARLIESERAAGLRRRAG
jgi:hypothetical protein